jgi:arabinoxylan arabinofuranohydrolase
VDTESRFADNPIIQTKFTADPAPLVYEDTVYLYTTHDEDNATGFTMYDWMLYSSTDMVNWTDHGVVATVREAGRTFAWADGYNAWAPQAIYHNNKFYLYCPLVRNGHMDIGVAVSDSPEGPFVDAIGAPLIHNPDSVDDIDPTVFVDDDGQAYLYWGHKRIFYVALNPDMISYSGSIVEFDRPELFEEGPWFYKRDGHYYLAFASYCCPEGIGYAMSDGPTGPWETKGYIMQPNNQSSGNHPGIIDYRGKSYVFGFNYVLNFAETSEHRERRSICVDELFYNADGTIVELPWWTEKGPAQLDSLDPYVQTEAETIAWSHGVKTEPCTEGGMNVSDIHNGDFIKVSGVALTGGASAFEARVASATDGGKIEIRLDSEMGELIGTCDVPGTGGWQEWQTVSCDLEDVNGFHNVYFRFSGSEDVLFNFNWWKVSR